MREINRIDYAYIYYPRPIYLLNLARVDLNLLIALDALLTDLNVTKAARRLNVSQPAMSSTLSRLRRMFGDELLVRGPGGMVPTPRALELLDPIRRLLRDVQQIIAPLSNFEPSASQETFVVAATDYVELLLVPRLVRRLRAAAPGVKLVLRSIEASKLPDDLISGRIDVGIAFFPSLSAKLRKRTLFTDEFTCVISPDSPLAKGPLTLPALLAATHLQTSASGRLGGRVDDALQEKGLRRQVNFVTSHFVAAASIASQTDVMTITGKRLAQYLASFLPLELRPLPFQTKPLNLLLAWHERTHRDPSRQWLRAQIEDSANELKG